MFATHFRNLLRLATRSSTPAVRRSVPAVRLGLEAFERRDLPSVTPLSPACLSAPAQPADNRYPSVPLFTGEAGDRVAATFQDSTAYHQLLRSAFGGAYDRGTAEEYRRMAVAGDYGFLPTVEFVDRAVLHGNSGAYDSGHGVVLLAGDLRSAPGQMRKVFLEETGHHLDAQLNAADTPGDEGELFRRLLSGERLNAGQRAAIRADDDHGSVTLNGQSVQVEFFLGFIGDAVDSVADAAGDAVDAVGDAAEAVGEAVGDAAEAVAGAVGDAAEAVVGGIDDAAGAVVDAAVAVGEGFVNAAKTIGHAVVDNFAKGVVGNLLQGRFGDALNSAVAGADKIVFGASSDILNGYINGAENLAKAPTYLLGAKVGEAARDVITRVADAQRTVTNAEVQILRTAVGAVAGTATTVVNAVGSAAKQAVSGNLGAAVNSVGTAAVNVGKTVVGGIVDGVLIGVQGATNVVGNALPSVAPSRVLTDAEKQFLKCVYGNSLDLSVIRVHEEELSTKVLAPHTVGNAIYLQTKQSGTAADLATLAHEAGHVWQSQNGGNAYIHEALLAQAKAAKETGDRNNAYPYAAQFLAGKSFKDMNPEQQAHVIEDIAEFVHSTGKTLKDIDDLHLASDGKMRLIIKGQFETALGDDNQDGKVTVTKDPKTTETRVTLTDAQLEQLIRIWRMVQSGGAVSESMMAGFTTTGSPTATKATPLAASSPTATPPTAAKTTVTLTKPTVAPVAVPATTKPTATIAPLAVSNSAAAVPVSVTVTKPATAVKVSAPVSTPATVAVKPVTTLAAPILSAVKAPVNLVSIAGSSIVK